MRTSTTKKNGRKGATMMLLMLGLPLVFLPLVGLAIDGTRLFIVQAKLSAAVDGAALGAGRLLGTVANTTEIANEFLNVNFPAGYWGTSNLNPTINYTNNLGTNTISVSATVQSPLLFMRIFGYPYSTVASAAVATRKNTRVVLVLDHSGSMNCLGGCPATMAAMVAGATQFTGMFTPNYDEMGLVAFSGSAIVAYPEYTPPYDPNPLSATQQGPDKNFALTTTTGPMFDQINAMVANGGTNSAEALSMAYLELQKGHNRDAAAGGDNNLNSIVFFTDGIPTALSVSPNNPSNNSLLSTSSCTYNPAHTTVDAAHTMAGWVVIHGPTPGPPSGWGGTAPNALMLMRSKDTAHTSTWWLANGLGDYGPSPTPGPPTWVNPAGTGAVNPNPYAAIAGCGGMNSSNWSTSDLAKIPSTDYWGNSTNGSAYNLGMSWASPCNVTYTPTLASNSCQWGLAIWNAVDNVGNTIRNGGGIAGYAAPTGMLPVTIFTIGYNGNAMYPIDPVLLKRLANTQDSTSYSSSQQVGMFIQVNNSTTLSAAFQQVASSLLRLAQ